MQNSQLQQQLREVIDFICCHGGSIRFLSSGVWVDREWDTPSQSTEPMFEILYLMSGQTKILLNGISHTVKKNEDVYKRQILDRPRQIYQRERHDPGF